MTDHVPAWARGLFSIHSTTVDDEPVPYLVGGEGPALIMLHGLNASLDWWQLNAPSLASQCRVYLVDLPGFGRLRHNTRTYGMQEFASWLTRFMDSVGLNQSHLLGLSMGADIVIQLAAQYPERTDWIILVAPMSVTPGDSIIAWAVTGARVLTELPAGMIPLALRDGYWATLITAWRSSRELIEEDASELLPRIRAKTLVLCSNNDQVLPLALAESILDMIPQAWLTVFPGAGHLLMLSQPDRFNRKVAEFLIRPHHETGRPSATSGSPADTGRQVMKNTT
jgi:pimeloyl-ACP methyl ester carboxylesterase